MAVATVVTIVMLERPVGGSTLASQCQWLKIPPRPSHHLPMEAMCYLTTL